MTGQLDRVTFSVSRAADFLEARALETQTGQPRHKFGWVCVKELADNALDAAESAGVAPEVTITVTPGDETQWLTVTDNGAGIPPETVTRILDFTTYTSDKALYRSPTRGLQGNALKTILGIPFALGVAEPVIIEARGVRHEVTLALDPARNLKVTHEQGESRRRAGTAVTVPLPADLDLSAGWWASAFALVNPHASFSAAELAHDQDDDSAESYKATAPDGWRKPWPRDKTSAWWYSPAEFAALACSLAATGDDRPAGKFVREDFRDLTGTAKASQIAAAVPSARRLSDIAENTGVAAGLLAAMKQASKIPQPGCLGRVASEHYEELLDRLYGVERFWHARGGITDSSGVAWQLEVAVAETEESGTAVYATNYSVSFADPLGDTVLRTAEVAERGAASFLASCDALPRWDNSQCRAVVVHVTCAAPPVLDKGKTRLVIPDEVAVVFAGVLWKAGKALRRDRASADRAADRAQAAERRQATATDRAGRAEAAAGRRLERQLRKTERAGRLSVREAVFAVIPEAVNQVTAGTTLPFSSHTLFYKIRPLALKLLPPGTTLRAQYVEQSLIPEYERDHGRISRMYREPRGELFEPHGGSSLPLGTLQVELYTPPSWSYDKVLVVEKAGLRPVLLESGIGNRFDMAIASCDGFGSEAARILLAKLRDHHVTIFVLHDADHSGYNIARTLAEETARMPGHRIEVIDIGLTVAEAIERGLEPEPYTRESALPARLTGALTDIEAEWFTGEVSGRNHHGKPVRWDCRRVELNALSSPELIAYVEDHLRRAGADGKVVPPGQVMRRHAWGVYDDDVAGQVGAAIRRVLDTDAITAEVRRIAHRRARMNLTRRAVRRAFRSAPEWSWRTVAADEAVTRLRDSGVDFDHIVRRLINSHLSAPPDSPAQENPT